MFFGHEREGITNTTFLSTKAIEGAQLNRGNQFPRDGCRFSREREVVSEGLYPRVLPRRSADEHDGLLKSTYARSVAMQYANFMPGNLSSLQNPSTSISNIFTWLGKLPAPLNATESCYADS